MPQQLVVKTQAKAIKATLILDPESFRGLVVPNGQAKSRLKVSVGDQTVTAELNAKSLRRCVTSVDAAEVGTFAVVASGKLEGSTLMEAGIAFQPKVPKPQSSEPVATEEIGQ